MFKTITRIKFSDCDPAGILFFGRVYELCHAAYEEMIKSFHLEEDYWSNDNFIVPIIKSEAHYHQPMKYGEEISIEISVKTLKSSSFELEYLLKNRDEVECVLVNTVHVFVDKRTWKKKAMKKEISNGFERFLGAN
ncbi:MAG TPA: acyl-CoA thioesterase [Ignavibacteriaceae bacterium]|nr:acyl-CoA thioesterase [Ignavibacteriaceae bacterium]